MPGIRDRSSPPEGQAHLESNWISSKFWEKRQKVTVTTESDGYIHVQIATQGLARRFLSALSSLLHIGKVRDIDKIQEDYAIKGDITPTQRKKIKNILAQTNKDLSLIRKELAYEIRNVIVDQSNSLRRQLHAAIKEIPKPDELPKVDALSPKVEDLLAPSDPIDAIAAFLPTIPPSPSAALPSEEPAISLSPDEIKERIQQLKEDLVSLSQTKVKGQESVTWLGTFFDRGHQLALHLFPKLHDWEEVAISYFSASMPVPEEDNQDYATLMHYQPHLRDLAASIEELEEIGLPDAESEQDIKELKSKLEKPMARAEWFQAYFLKCEALDTSLEQLDDQMIEIDHGRLNCSLEPYKAVLDQVKQLEKLRDTTEKSDPRWQQKLERKCDYQLQMAYDRLEQMSETLIDTVNVEFKECKAHLEDVEKRLKTADPASTTNILEEVDRAVFCYRSFVNIQQKLLADLNALDTSPELNDFCKKQIQVFKHSIEKIEKQIKEIDTTPLEAATLEPKELNLEAVRAKRIPLSRDRKAEIKRQKEIAEGGEYSPGTKKALRLFFGYLQVWDLVSPMAAKFIKPIGKRDYDYYLSKMADAMKEGNTKEYEVALNRARSFFNADLDFLDSYEKYLKGEMTFMIQKMPAKRDQIEGGTSLTDQLAETAESVLPTSVGRWVSTFLGHGEEGRFNATATEWERWAHHHIYPAYRDQGFDNIMQMFDKTPPNTPAENSSDEEKLNFYFYKLYQSAKNPEERKNYEANLAEAKGISQYELFTKEFDSYLKSQLKAFDSPIEAIPLTTLALGKATLKTIQKDAVAFVEQVDAEQDLTESAAYADSLQSHTQEIELHRAKCQELLKTAPPEYASKQTTKKWLREVEACRTDYVAEKHETDATITREKWKDEISLAKLQSFLDSPPVPATDLTIAQAFGANFLYGLPIDQAASLDTINFRLQALRQRIEVIKQNPLCTESNAAAFCTEYLNDPVFAKRLKHSDVLPYLEKLEAKLSIAQQLSDKFAHQHIASFQQALQQEISSLNIEDSVFFSDNEHGMSYEIIRQPSTFFSYYTLRIYSADPRHAFQEVVIEDSKEKIVPFTEITDIAFSQISSATTWQNLKKSMESSKENRPSQKTILKQLVRDTRGKVNSQRKSPKDFIESTQNSHYQTLAALFSTEFSGSQQAPRLEFETQFKVLHDVQSKLTKGDTHYDAALLKQGVASFAAKLPTWLQEGIINHDELIFVVKFAEKLERSVTKGEATQTALETKTSTTTQLTHVKVNTRLELLPAPLDLSQAKPIPNSPETLEKSTELASKAETYPSAPVITWDGQPSTLVLEFDNFLSEFQLPAEDPSIGIAYAQEFIRRIPLSDTGFWEALPIEDASKVLDKLQTLNRAYTALINLRTKQEPTHPLSKEEKLSPQEYLAKIKILALTNRLINEFNLLDSPISLYSPALDPLLNENSPSLQLDDPSWTKELHELKIYWNTIKQSSAPKLVDQPIPAKQATLAQQFPWAYQWIVKNRRQLKELIFLDIYKAWDIAALDSKNLGYAYGINESARSDLKDRAKEGLVRTVINDDFLFAYMYARGTLDIGISSRNRSPAESPIFPSQTHPLIIDKQKSTLHLPKIFQQAEEILFSVCHYPHRDPRDVVELISQNIGLDGYYNPDDTIPQFKIAWYNSQRTHSLQKFDPRQIMKLHDMVNELIDQDSDLSDTEFRKLVTEEKWRDPPQINTIVKQFKTAFEALLIAANSNRLRIEPNQIPLYSAEMQIRDLIALSSSSEVQIQDTISYFTKNTPLLGKVPFQQLLKYLIFEGDLLFNEFEKKSPLDNQKFLTDLTQFCKQSLTYFENIKDYQTVSFLLKFSHQLDANIHKISSLQWNKDLPGLLKDGYSPVAVRTELRRLLDKPGLSLDGKALMHRALAYTYASEHSSLTTESAVELIAAMIQQTIHALPEEWTKIEEAENIVLHDLLKSKIDLLLPHFTEQNRDNTLNAIYKKIHPESTQTHWDPASKFPLFKSSDGKIEINVLQGTLRELGGTVSYLPITILKHPNFIAVFGKKQEMACTQIKSDGSAEATEAFMTVGPQGRTYKLISYGNQQLVIQTKFEGKWYQLITDEKQMHKLGLPESFKLNNDCWYTDAQSATEVPGTPSLMISDKQTGAARYAIVKDKVYKVDAHGKKTSDVAVSIPPNSPLETLVNGFDSPESTLIFSNELTDELSSIVFPRYGLEFTMQEVKGEKRAVCSQEPDFYLSQSSQLPEFPHLRNHLILESQLSSETLLKIALIPLPQKLGVHFSAFKIDPSTNKLIPQSPTEGFHLAYLNLLQGKYKAAYALMQQFEVSSQPYNNVAKQLLRLISELPTKEIGTHVQARALQLKAAALLLKNSQKDIEDKTYDMVEAKAISLLDHYGRYLHSREDAALTSLSDEEERLLIRSLSPSLDTISYPIHKLIVDRMQALGIPLTEELSLMQGFEASSVPFDVNPYMQFRDINLNNLLTEDSQAQSLFPLHNKKFQEQYRFIRTLHDPEQHSWEELHDFAYRLSGETPGFFSRFASRDSLINKIKTSLQTSSLNASPQKQLSFFLLQGVLHAPELFPHDISRLQDISLYPAEKKSWGREWLINPLKKLALTSTEMQKLFAPLPNRVTPKLFSRTQPITAFDISIDLRKFPPIFEPNFPVPVEAVLTEFHASAAQSTKVTTLKTTLAELSALPLKDKNLQQNLADLSTQFDEFTQSPQAVLREYKIKDAASFKVAQIELLDAAKKIEPQLNKLKDEIESMANHLSLTQAQRAIRTARFLASQDQPISLDEAIQLYLRRDISLVHARNPALTIPEIAKIFHAVEAYLVSSVHYQHINSAIALMDQIDKQIAANAPPEDVKGLTRQLANVLSEKRSFDITKSPMYLALEHYSGYILRESNVRSLDSLEIINGKITKPQNIGKVLEVIMGSGKTTSILPILGMLNADGFNTAIGVIPKVLMESVIKVLKKQMGTAFHQSLVVMEFNRDSRFDKKALNGILDSLTDIRENKKVMLVSNESLKALFLKMAEKIGDYNQAKAKGVVSSALKEEIPLFLEIFDRLKKSGSLAIDEVDMILDILKSFHFTFGKPSAQYLLPAETVTDIYRFLLKNREIRPLLRLESSPTETSKAVSPFTAKHYHEKIKPVLLKAIMEGQLQTGGDEWKAFMDGLWSGQRAKVMRFLQGDLSSDVLSFTNSIASEKVQDILAVLKEQLNELLPLTLSKNVHEHYGPSTQIAQGGEKLLAIPYHLGRATPDGTQFGMELETLNYTPLMYLSTKLTPSTLNSLLETLQNKIRTFLHDNPEAILENVPDYKFFQGLTDHDPQYNIFSMSPNQTELLAKLINNDPEKILDLVMKTVLPEIKIYDRQLNADALLFGALFKQIQGMSGTVWNAQTYTKAISEVISSNTAAKTLFLIPTDKPIKIVSITSIQNPTSLKSSLKQIVDSPSNQPRSLIDTANTYRGIPNEAVAKSLLEIAEDNGWNTKGVIYYDTQDKIMVMTRVANEWKPVEKELCEIPKEELLAYWDQSHTTGSDLKLSSTMIAAVTISRHTLFRDVLQSVWRLRGLADYQTVEFVTSEEDRDIIIETIEKISGKKVDGPLQFKDILLYTMNQQAERQGQDNYRSFKQKIRAVVLEKAVTAMTESKDADAAAEIYEICQSLFETTQERRPYKMFAYPSNDRPKEDVVKDEIAQFLSTPMIAKIDGHPILKKFSQSIREEIQALATSEIDYLPDRLKQGATYGTERSIETQKETETQQQTQVEVSVNVARSQNVAGSTRKRSGDFIPIPVQSWLSIEKKLKSTTPERTIKISGNFQLVSVVDSKYFTKNAKLIHSVSKVLTGSFNQVASSFDSRLLCSENLCPVGFKKGIVTSLLSLVAKVPIYTPFDDHQKNFNQLLVIKNKKSGEIQVMMIDQNDEKQWKKILTETLEFQRRNPFLKDENTPEWIRDILVSDVQVALYDLTTGIYMQGSDTDRIDAIDLEKDPNFINLRTQAKFFKGETHYNRQELNVLEKWLLSIDHKAMRTFFAETILPWAGADIAKFNQTPLGRLFKQLEQTTQAGFFASLFKKFS